MIEILRQGLNDGVIHCRSKHSGHWLSFLESDLHIGPARIRELFELGSIYDEHHRIQNWDFFTTTVPAGSYCRVHTEPRRYDLGKCSKAPLIHFENLDFLVCLKPPGIPCHPTVDNQVENLISFLEKERREKLFLTHRLDLGTQGLLVIGRNPGFQKKFNSLLSQRLVTKKYRAWTEQAVTFTPPRLLRHWMEVSPKAPKVVHPEAFDTGLFCELEIQSVEKHRLEIELGTGRTHQIRSQLSQIGYPILGDLAYGSRREPWGKDHWALQAFQLSWKDEQDFFFEINAPKEILQFFESTVEKP